MREGVREGGREGGQMASIIKLCAEKLDLLQLTYTW